jgi:hypothetical protein
MSLRATGEGHISSIVFQTGVVNAAGNIELDSPSAYYTPLKKSKITEYSKEFIKSVLLFSADSIWIY